MDSSTIRGGVPGGRMGRTSQVKNRAPAAVQITAEQILREAQEYKEESHVVPRQQITDPEEMKEYQARRRKEFEDGIRKNNHNFGLWMRYAAWEAKLGELQRARSVFERAMDIDYRNAGLWTRYAEMEMRHKQIAYARNVWDRAVQLLPRIDQLWYKYAYMEEMLGEEARARQVFERWMAFHPNEQAWLSYIKFELRHHHVDRARALYDRYTIDHLSLDAYLRYAKFESRHGEVDRARAVFERAQEELDEKEKNDPKFFLTFAAFEERHKEYDRARAIYQYALDHLTRAQAREIYDRYVSFEKSYGDKDGIELVILAKRRFQYEEEIKAESESAAASNAANGNGFVYNYDIWFDYLRLELDRLESLQTSSNPALNSPTSIGSQAARIRELFERAVSNLPPPGVRHEKRWWKRYIYLWIEWLIFEEVAMRDIERTRTIFTQLLGPALIPHDSHFSFAKLWLLYAQFEVRQGRLDLARAKLGEGLGRLAQAGPALHATRLKVFKGYITLETQLGALERVRTLHTKLVESHPEAAEAWIEFAAFETRLGENERCRAIYELAASQQVLDEPEKVWKSYISSEVARGESGHVRSLYERLLQRTKHVKVWASYAAFEVGLKQLDQARNIFRRGEEYFKNEMRRQQQDEDEMNKSHGLIAAAQAAQMGPSAALLTLKEDRLLLLQSWRDMERNLGTPDSLQQVNKLLPQQLKKRRPILVMNGEGNMVPGGAFEEYYDYAFPEDKQKAAGGGLKILEMAKMWKKQQEQKAAEEQSRLMAEVDAIEAEEEEQVEEDADHEAESLAAIAKEQPSHSPEEEEQPGAAEQDNGPAPMEQ